MATTTNYGWATPDDTDLDKDGAAAIRTLGTSIDTSFAADEGDLLVGGTSDIFEALPIGPAGTVLTSDGDTAEWAAAAGGGMTLLTTLTLSGASVTSSAFSSSYKRLFIYIHRAVSSSAGPIRMRLNGDSGSNYLQGRVTNSGTAAPTGSASDSLETYARVGLIGDTNTDIRAAYSIIRIDNPSNTDAVFISGSSLCHNSGSGNLNNESFNNIYDSTAAITTITLFLSGLTFSSGTASIYGVN